MAAPAELQQRFPNVSRESWDRLATYVELLLKWQQRINLIGPSTQAEVWTRHIADSLEVLPLLGAEEGAIADLGSGAGLPGMVLAITSGRTTDLYDSNQKKAAFLREAARVTGAHAQVHAVRLEEVAQHLPKVMPRFVTARALAPLTLLLDWASPFLLAGATGYFHKGQDLDSELTDATKYWKMKAIKHPSLTDSRGVILEVKECVRHV